MRLGIMAAMPQEVNTIHDDLDFHKEENHGERLYYFSQYGNIEIILVYSRVGKVSAASTVTTLIDKYAVDCVIFTGVAGAVDSKINIGDIIIGTGSYQHDMDGRPLFPRFEVPLTGRSLFQSHEKEIDIAAKAVNNFISNINTYVNSSSFDKFNIKIPAVHFGTIATGDQFIKNPLSHDGLKLEKTNVLAVEMEGAAVAQVCTEHNISFVLIRTISDKADHSAAGSFQLFIDEIASHYSSGIVREYLKLNFTTDFNP